MEAERGEQASRADDHGGDHQRGEAELYTDRWGSKGGVLGDDVKDRLAHL